MSIAMDHQWRIYINPQYVTSNTIERVAAVLIHEINHALRSHAERGRRTATPALDGFWRIACEFEINDDLEYDGLDIGDGLLPDYFGLEYQDTAELYYQHLIEHSVCVGALPDCGPICSTHPHHPQGLDACGTQGLTAAQQLLAQQATAAAVLQYDLDGGDVPFGLHEWAQHSARPVVDWRQTLARLLRSTWPLFAISVLITNDCGIESLLQDSQYRSEWANSLIQEHYSIKVTAPRSTTHW